MDVGTFKASRGRLITWIVLPPALILTAGLGGHAWQQQAEWNLVKAQSVVNVLPQMLTARVEASKLAHELQFDSESTIRSEDQMITYIQEAAVRNGFVIDSIQVNRRDKNNEQSIPGLHASIEGNGDFLAIQQFIMEIRNKHQLLSIGSIKLTQPRVRKTDSDFNADITLQLLLIDEVLKVSGGVQ